MTSTTNGEGPIIFRGTTGLYKVLTETGVDFRILKYNAHLPEDVVIVLSMEENAITRFLDNTHIKKGDQKNE